MDSQVFYQHQMAPAILRIARDRGKRQKSLFCWAQRSLGGLWVMSNDIVHSQNPNIQKQKKMLAIFTKKNYQEENSYE